jgi:hypothetical protein
MAPTSSGGGQNVRSEAVPEASFAPRDETEFNYVRWHPSVVVPGVH